MKLWRYLSDSKERERLHFFRFVESDDARELMAAATTVFTALWPVVRPLAVTLTVAAWPHGSFGIDSKIPVPISYWHLYEMRLPQFWGSCATFVLAIKQCLKHVDVIIQSDHDQTYYA